MLAIPNMVLHLVLQIGPAHWSCTLNYENKITYQMQVLASSLIGNTESPPALCCIDLEKPEEESKWAFVSNYKIGLRPHHDSLLKSKKSQIRAHKEELDQRSSIQILTYFFSHLEMAKSLLPYLIFRLIFQLFSVDYLR